MSRIIRIIMDSASWTLVPCEHTIIPHESHSLLTSARPGESRVVQKPASELAKICIVHLLAIDELR